jgi:hypothetical protein
MNIQNLILRTADVTPLKHLYSASYRWALRAAGRALARLRDVDAVLLRTSGPDYRFDPGVSDIDLTVIHRAASDEDTLAFLEEFWTTYHRLKQWLPMLGEMEILTAEEFSQIARLAPQLAKIQKTYVPVSIKRAFPGKDLLDAALQQEPVEPAVPRILAFVFTKYTTAALPRLLAQCANPTLVHRKRLERQLATAGSTLSEAMTRLGVAPFEPAGAADPLMRRAAQFYADLSRCSARLAKDTFGPGRTTIAGASVAVPDELARFAADVFGDLDVSLLWSRPIYFPQSLAMAVVTNDDLEPSAFAGVVDRLLRFRREIPASFRGMLSGDAVIRHFRVDGWPFMMTRSTFRWFSELSPFYFPSFSLSERPSLSGASLEMIAASRETCLREVLLHYRNFLSLKNNWQSSPTPDARIALYRATVEYIDGYVSFVRGSGLSGPRSDSGRAWTLLDAYRELRQSLQRLGQALSF